MDFGSTYHLTKINVTLVFTVAQGLIAAKSGATYVSPFLGRLEDISSDGLAVSHMATMPGNLFPKLWSHPLTDSGTDAFIKDWENFEKISNQLHKKRRSIVAMSYKNYLNKPEEVGLLVEEIILGPKESSTEFMEFFLFSSIKIIESVARCCKGSNLGFGAQNIAQ